MSTEPVCFVRRGYNDREIQAMQFLVSDDGTTNIQDIWDAFGTAGIYGPTEKNPDYLLLTTVIDSQVPCHENMWVVKDEKAGAFYPMDEELLRESYQLADAVKKREPVALYVRKPDTKPIPAIQFTGENVGELWDAFGTKGILADPDRQPGPVFVETAQGQRVEVNDGEWITPDAEPGSFYPIKNDVFLARFEPHQPAGDTQAPPPGNRYRRIHDGVIVEAIQYKYDNTKVIHAAFGSDAIYAPVNADNPELTVYVSVGDGLVRVVYCAEGDWVLYTPQGLAVVRNEAFRDLYEPCHEPMEMAAGLYTWDPDPTKVAVKAARYTGSNLDELATFFKTTNIYETAATHPNSVYALSRAGGNLLVTAGDWIVESEVPNRFYTIKDDRFVEQYTPFKAETPAPKSGKPTHYINLSVMVSGPDQWREVFSSFTDYLQDLGAVYPAATLSSHCVDEDGADDEDEVLRIDPQDLFDQLKTAFDGSIPEADTAYQAITEAGYEVFKKRTLQTQMSSDDALNAVRSTLLDEGLPEKSVHGVVSRLLNAGVVFRGTEEVEKRVTASGETLEKFESALATAVPNLSELELVTIVNEVLNAGLLIWERG